MASKPDVPKSGPHVVVLGAGVVGMSTAAALLCHNASIVSNMHVTIVAAAYSPNTTSDIAGGLWLPYKADHPEFAKWCAETLDWLYYLHKQGKLPLNAALQSNTDSEPNPYRVNLVEGVSYEATTEIAEARETWVHALKEPVKQVPISELPYVPPATATCVIMQNLPLVTTNKYLQRMKKEIESTGRVTCVLDKDIRSVREAASKYHADVVINCTGLGARQLLLDTSVKPVRGCLVTLQLPTDVQHKLLGRAFLYDDNPAGLTYVLPREDGCHVGGTYYPDQWDTTVSDEERAQILDRAYHVVPELKHGKVIKQRAGLRPGRPNIRVEQDRAFEGVPSAGTYTKDTLVFHNYGHGGSGWTVHWGCALTIANLVTNALIDTNNLQTPGNSKTKAKL